MGGRPRSEREMEGFRATLEGGIYLILGGEGISLHGATSTNMRHLQKKG